MQKDRVLFTGLSSFTGSGISETLAQNGLETYGTLQQKSLQSYQGVRRMRLEHAVKLGVKPVYGVNLFSSEETVKLVKMLCPKFFVFHHHPMKDFRSGEYSEKDAIQSVLEGSKGLLDELEKQKNAGSFFGLLYTSTFFEPFEGGDLDGSRPSTAYARSKREIYLFLENECKKRKITFSSIVLPSPVGLFENPDRLIPSLFKSFLEKKEFEVRSEDSISDYLPMDELSKVYWDEISSIQPGGKIERRRPSGFVKTTKEWIEDVSKEVFVKRLSEKAPRINFSSQGTATVYRNDILGQKIEIDQDAFWNLYAEGLFRFQDSLLS